MEYRPNENEKFVNPYHFVRLAEKLEARFKKNYRDETTRADTLTGWLECELTTKSPIFIPNRTKGFTKDVTVKDKDDNNKEKPVSMPAYDFFSYTDLQQEETSAPAHCLDDVTAQEPVIPGSEIRGMIRSAFEAVTHSCVSSVDDEKILYKRVQWPVPAGRLIRENSQWKIQPCQKYKIKVDDYVEDFKKVDKIPIPSYINAKDFFEIDKNLFVKFEKERSRGYRKQQPKTIPMLCYRGKMSEKVKNTLFKLLGSNGKSQLLIRSLYEKSYQWYSLKSLRALQKDNPDNKVWFKTDGSSVIDILKAEPANTSGWKIGFLHIGERFLNKTHESIFELDGEAFPLPEPERTIQNLQENLKLYQDDRINLHLDSSRPKTERHFGYEDEYRNLENLNGALIYFAKYNDYYYLCPAAIGRQVFHHRLKDLLKTFQPCSTIDKVCDACGLFGLAGRGEAAASRVRFTDAHRMHRDGNPESLYDTPQILKELASPKLSATEFYLRKPLKRHHNNQDTDLWNYDYALRWRRGNNRKTKNGNPDISSFSSYQPQIRGRKFYWHHKDPSQAYVTDDDLKNKPNSASDRNVQVRPLHDGVSFSFRVYFNNITQEELKKLLWVLEVGGKDSHAHKIGMGKPLGLGSVQLRVTAIKKRKLKSVNKMIKYCCGDIEGTEDKEKLKTYKSQIHAAIETKLGAGGTVLDDFLALTNFTAARENVRYPYNKDKNNDDTATFSWFVGNKQVTKKDGSGAIGTAPSIYQVLPDITSPTHTPELDTYQEK